MSTLKTFNLQHPSSAVINASLESNGAITAANIFNGNSGINISANGNVTLSSNGSVRMTIDTAGRILSATNPGFIAFSSGATATYTSGQKVLYGGTVVRDKGGNYSAANSRFTAPIAGLYLFKAQLWMYSTNAGAARFAVNGTQVQGSFGNEAQSINWNGIAMIEIFNLAANDYVEVFCRTSTVYTDSAYSTFSGFLIG